MRTEMFDMPSGARLEFRSLTIREENLLASSRGKSMEKTLNRVISDCTVSVVDPGPYNHLSAGGSVDWAKMLQGDRFVAMFLLRLLSYKDGDEYTFKAQCPACNRRDFQTVNLREELPIQELTEEAQETFKSGGLFSVTVDGKLVKFRLPLVEDAHRLEKLAEQNPGRDMAVAMRLRIKEVEGLEASEILDWLDGGKTGDPLSSEEAEVLREAFDEVDCGIDTEIEVQCRCGAFNDVTLPFDAAFFLPSRVKGKQKRKGRRLGLGS